MRFKEGDRVMFLGAPEHDSDSILYSREDSLIPMQVYIVVRQTVHSDRISLKRRAYWHRNKYFQKVEGKL